MPMLRLSHVKEFLEGLPDETVVGKVGLVQTATKHPFCLVLKKRTGRSSQILPRGDGQWELSVGKSPPRVRYTLSSQMSFLADLLAVWNKETKQTTVTAKTMRRMVKLANRPHPNLSPAGHMIRERFP